MTLYSCTCGGFKFRTTYSQAYCCVCRRLQQGIVFGNLILIKIPAPEIEQVVILSTTD